MDGQTDKPAYRDARTHLKNGLLSFWLDFLSLVLAKRWFFLSSSFAMLLHNRYEIGCRNDVILDRFVYFSISVVRN